MVIDVTEFERLVEEIEILRDIRLGERQLENGEGIPHEESKARVLATLKR